MAHRTSVAGHFCSVLLPLLFEIAKTGLSNTFVSMLIPLHAELAGCCHLQAAI